MTEDKLFSMFGKMDSKKKVMMPNEEKIALVRRLFQVAQNITKGCEVELELFKPFSNMGVISFEGKKVYFEDSGVFAEMAELADNIEVYPKLNGNIHINFTFYKISIPVEG